MDQLTFDEWWEEFLNDTHPREDFYETLHRLRTFIGGLSSTKRDAFVAGMVDVACDRRDGWSLALSALERFGGREARRRLHDTVIALPEVRPPHPLGDYRDSVLRVLASDSESEFIAPVEEFCRQQIGPGFTGVVWALWPHRRDMFARYHARFFVEAPAEWWARKAVIQAFVSEPEALVAVRDALRDQPSTWEAVREAALWASSGSSVAPDRSVVIHRICG